MPLDSQPLPGGGSQVTFHSAGESQSKVHFIHESLPFVPPAVGKLVCLPRGFSAGVVMLRMTGPPPLLCPPQSTWIPNAHLLRPSCHLHPVARL